MSLLRGLDSGNRTIMRCRDILAKLISNIDARGLLISACMKNLTEERWLIEMKQRMPPI